MKKRAVILTNNPESVKRVYSKGAMNKLHKLVDLHGDFISEKDFGIKKDILSKTDVAFSTWGMPHISEELLKDLMPKLKILFYGAGSVQSFARPFLKSGIKVVSAWAANAVPVAEYSLAQILLANKGFYQNTNLSKRDFSQARRYTSTFPGNYAVKVGILGAGMIGTLVIGMLKSHKIQVMVFDPFLSDERAKGLGVIPCSLTEIFSTCQTISNHIANNPATIGLLDKKYFNIMLDNATFINTGRGLQIVEEDLVEALSAVPTRTAILDVTYPEPVEKGHAFLKMDNVFLTSHIAGSMGNEVERMAWYMIDEFIRYEHGEELKYNVTLEMLETMA